MATLSRREVTTARVEFHVPTDGPLGSVRNDGTLGPAEIPSDDRIRLHCAGEAIVVTYEAVPYVHS